MERGIQVRLLADLTNYHSDLVQGVKGMTVGPYGMWSRGSDRFVGVYFPEIGTYDILWESLEIIDKEYLEEAQKREQKRHELLKEAKNVVRFIGPRGGFRHLSYEYIGENGTPTRTTTTDRNEAKDLIAFFERHKITVFEKIA